MALSLSPLPRQERLLDVLESGAELGIYPDGGYGVDRFNPFSPAPADRVFDACLSALEESIR